jgi:hypothetical protein
MQWQQISNLHSTNFEVFRCAMFIQLTFYSWKCTSNSIIYVACTTDLRFMQLKQNMPDEEFSPSLTLDDVWHTHITCTKAYMAFFDEYFGAYVHHDPTLFPVKRYHDTLAAYFKFFSNNPPALAWPEPTIALPGTKKAAAAAKTAAKRKP